MLASTFGFEIRSLESKNDCFELVLCQGSKGLSEKKVMDESEFLIKSIEGFRYLFGALKDKLVECLDSGQTIGSHGATNGLNTFLHVTGLGETTQISIFMTETSQKKIFICLPILRLLCCLRIAVTPVIC